MKDFIVKYRFYIVAGLLAIVFLRSCGKTRSINRFEKSEIFNAVIVDSLQSVIKLKDHRLDSIPEVIRIEKLTIYLSLDDTISRVDRTPQLMGFHTLIKDKIKGLQ